MTLTRRGRIVATIGVTLVTLVIMGLLGYVETLGYW